MTKPSPASPQRRAPDAPHAGADRLGTPLTPVEAEVLRIYNDLKRFVARDDLPPCVSRNAKKALAAVHVAANDLDLVYEHLYELGV